MKRDISREDVDALYGRIGGDAQRAGYHVNPDETFAKDLARSLLVNEERYGAPLCPCRLASGNLDEDRDIVCPCDYRDADLEEFGACFCALYVSQAAADGAIPIEPVPERRPPLRERLRKDTAPLVQKDGLSHPVWRCPVCGYLCAREAPPESCPICKAKKDRFQRFM